MIDNIFAIVSGIVWLGVAIFIFCWNKIQPPSEDDKPVLNIVGIGALFYGLFCLKLAI